MNELFRNFPVTQMGITLALVLCRCSAWVVASPFPGAQMGQTGRFALMIALTLSTVTVTPHTYVPETLDGRAIEAAFGEIGLGLLLGFTFQVVFSAAEVLGSVLSVSTSLATPSVLNPTLGNIETPMARLATLGAMALALAAGVHRVVIGTLLATFRALPVGVSLHTGAATGALIDLSSQALSVGLQLAMPTLAITLLVQLSLAMIARAAPALQIFSVGLSILVSTGLLVMLVSLHDVGTGIVAALQAVGPALEQVLRVAGAPVGG